MHVPSFVLILCMKNSRVSVAYNLSVLMQILCNEATHNLFLSSLVIGNFYHFECCFYQVDVRKKL